MHIRQSQDVTVERAVSRATAVAPTRRAITASAQGSDVNDGALTSTGTARTLLLCDVVPIKNGFLQ